MLTSVAYLQFEVFRIIDGEIKAAEVGHKLRPSFPFPPVIPVTESGISLQQVGHVWEQRIQRYVLRVVYFLDPFDKSHRVVTTVEIYSPVVNL